MNAITKPLNFLHNLSVDIWEDIEEMIKHIIGSTVVMCFYGGEFIIVHLIVNFIPSKSIFLICLESAAGIVIFIQFIIYAFKSINYQLKK